MTDRIWLAGIRFYGAKCKNGRVIC
uniref:Uncharacterized protein n=1 Tax=Arundo donax TaxID=35708 RepID=A0A0A9CYI1_ARUDO